MKPEIIFFVFSLFLFSMSMDVQAQPGQHSDGETDEALNLITDTPEEGFQVAIELARKGVTSTQPDRDVLFMLRDVYSKDPDALIASSQVIAIHFRTVAEANNYWKNVGGE